MNSKRFLIFSGWSFFVMAATGCALFVMTFGDCSDDASCKAAANHNLMLILAIGFCVYWLVSLLLFWRWNR